MQVTIKKQGIKNNLKNFAAPMSKIDVNYSLGKQMRENLIESFLMQNYPYIVDTITCFRCRASHVLN